MARHARAPSGTCFEISFTQDSLAQTVREILGVRPITLGHTEHSSQKDRVQTGGYQVLLPSITVSPLCRVGSEGIFGS